MRTRLIGYFLRTFCSRSLVGQRELPLIPNRRDYVTIEEAHERIAEENRTCHHLGGLQRRHARSRWTAIRTRLN